MILNKISKFQRGIIVIGNGRIAYSENEYPDILSEKFDTFIHKIVDCLDVPFKVEIIEEGKSAIIIIDEYRHEPETCELLLKLLRRIGLAVPHDVIASLIGSRFKNDVSSIFIKNQLPIHNTWNVFGHDSCVINSFNRMLNYTFQIIREIIPTKSGYKRLSRIYSLGSFAEFDVLYLIKDEFTPQNTQEIITETHVVREVSLDSIFGCNFKMKYFDVEETIKPDRSFWCFFIQKTNEIFPINSIIQYSNVNVRNKSKLHDKSIPTQNNLIFNFYDSKLIDDAHFNHPRMVVLCDTLSMMYDIAKRYDRFDPSSILNDRVLPLLDLEIATSIINKKFPNHNTLIYNLSHFNERKGKVYCYINEFMNEPGIRNYYDAIELYAGRRNTSITKIKHNYWNIFRSIELKMHSILSTDESAAYFTTMILQELIKKRTIQKNINSNRQTEIIVKNSNNQTDISTPKLH